MRGKYLIGGEQSLPNCHASEGWHLRRVCARFSGDPSLRWDDATGDRLRSFADPPSTTGGLQSVRLSRKFATPDINKLNGNQIRIINRAIAVCDEAEAVMLYSDEQGHDSQIEGITIDTSARTASIILLSYTETDSAKRVKIEIAFVDVVSMTAYADMLALADNKAAGNVSHWNIAEGEGTSHFYLIEGYLAVTSRSAPKLIRK